MHAPDHFSLIVRTSGYLTVFATVCLFLARTLSDQASNAEIYRNFAVFLILGLLLMRWGHFFTYLAYPKGQYPRDVETHAKAPMETNLEADA